MKKGKLTIIAAVLAVSLVISAPTTSFAAIDGDESYYDNSEDETIEMDIDDEDESDNSPVSYDSYGLNYPLPYPKTINSAELSGNPRKDVIAIAKSQLGYKEIHDGDGRKYTWYADVCASNGSAWCSEFSAWCLYMAGMPVTVLSCTSVNKYWSYFAYFGDDEDNEVSYIHDLEGGHPMGSDWVGSRNAGTLKLSDIEPGDIILMRTPNQASKSAPEPHHTCLVRKVDTGKKKIYVYDGNSGSGDYKKVASSVYDASTVYAVIKVPYETAATGGSSNPSLCNHKYVPISSNAGNCKTPDTVTYKCIYCGSADPSRTNIHLQYGPHDYKRTILRKPSASAAGVYKYTCRICGKSYTENYSVKTFTVGKIKYKLSTNGKRAYVTGASSKKIKSVTIPQKVKYNGKTYPVTRINSHAFFKYSKLKKVTIKADLEYVKSWSFYKCTKLKTVRFTSSTVPSIQKNAFAGIYKKAKITVPKSVYSKYKAALKKGALPKKAKIKKG